MKNKIKCPICGTEIEDDTYQDCPYCDWTYVGIECVLDEDEVESENGMSIRQARENVAKGLDIWGDPLPKKKQ